MSQEGVIQEAELQFSDTEPSVLDNNENAARPVAHPKFQTFGILKLICTTSFGSLYPQVDTLVTSMSLVNIGAYFHVDIDVCQWILLSYLILSSVCGAFIGRMGERVGIDMMFKFAYLGLTIVNLVITFSPNIYLIIVVRIFGGIFNSCGVATHAYLQRFLAKPAIITTLMSRQATALSVFNIAFPLIVGVVGDINENGWRYCYAILSAICLYCTIASFIIIPRLPKTKTIHFDPIGILLYLIIVVSIIMAINVVTFSWPWYVAVLCLLVAGGTLTGFIFFERKTKYPMIPMEIIGQKDVLLFFLTVIVGLGAFGAKSVLIPYVVKISFGKSTLVSSLFICIVMVMMAITSLIAEKVFGKFITKMMFFSSFILMFVGCLILGLGDYFMSMATMGVGCAIQGIGIGLFFVCLMTSIFRLGGNNLTLFSGLNNSFQNIGKSLFTALVSMGLEVFQNVFVGGAGNPSPETDEFKKAYAKAVGVVTICLAVVLLIAGVISLFMNITANERGKIGFKESKLDYNNATGTIMYDVAPGEEPMVELNESSIFESDF